jgi:hypothetical protein
LALRRISVRSLKEILSGIPCVPKGIITVVSKISQYDQGTVTARKYKVPDASLEMCKHVEGSDSVLNRQAFSQVKESDMYIIVSASLETFMSGFSISNS